jgi:hypothetical protein
MDLVMKVLVLVIIVALIAVVVFYATGGHIIGGALTQTQATQLVLKDINASNPGAIVSVVNASPSTLAQNSWNIVLSVVYNATKPCPTLFIEGFDYPATGLSPSTYNQYTTKCIIYGISTAPSYVISSPYIAIARSYNNSVAQNYVNDYSYSNVNVYAKFYSALNATQTPLNKPYDSVWIINYTATTADFNLYLILSLSGSLLGNYTQIK